MHLVSPSPLPSPNIGPGLVLSRVLCFHKKMFSKRWQKEAESFALCIFSFVGGRPPTEGIFTALESGESDSSASWKRFPLFRPRFLLG